jgi:hypothetical protein
VRHILNLRIILQWIWFKVNRVPSIQANIPNDPDNRCKSQLCLTFYRFNLTVSSMKFENGESDSW